MAEPDEKLTGLLRLPPEILLQILERRLHSFSLPGSLEGATDKAWKDPNRMRRHKHKTQLLWSLCLSSRKLSSIATPFLYRSIILRRGSPLRRARDPNPRPFLSADSLVLLLRTLLESPRLRVAVRELDCYLFLKEFPPHCSLEFHAEGEPKRQVDDWLAVADSWARLSDSISMPGSEHDRRILGHVGMPWPGLPTRFPHLSFPNLAERLFAAVLFLCANLRSVTLRCLPYWPDFPPAEIRYDTLSKLLESSLEDPILRNTTLQNLDVVRFASQEGIKAAGLDRTGSGSTDCFFTRVDTCPGLVQIPSVMEIGSHITNGGWKEVGDINPNIQRVTISSLHPNRDVGLASNAWSLSELVVIQLPWWDPEEPDHVDYESASPSIADALLRKQADTLTVLDLREIVDLEMVASTVTSLMPPSQLFPAFSRLETLRISSVALESEKGLARQLNKVLPPLLKTLHISAYNADVLTGDAPPGGFNNVSIHKVSESLAGEIQSGLRAGEQYIPHLTAALHMFAPVCGETHPKLRSIIIEGEVRLFDDLVFRWVPASQYILGGTSIVDMFSMLANPALQGLSALLRIAINNLDCLTAPNELAQTKHLTKLGNWSLRNLPHQAMGIGLTIPIRGNRIHQQLTKTSVLAWTRS
ncbi:hypothetical protein SODALDRAFT_376879 [Sodiomyces alkalinus F11]|uniref:Uncharacterized protein n=1 Tax=Sodiomyces alkalinus (strain CBS 110278 / VKM F-3762 / F11) TaxID=1314773 RepID=A0A3N2Q358_SODAK|nr:hypothetical protein SODALDRAFT_376879 [Sodiomyces alkalinus F11]ROT41180.1 hypothetical protein SODALDRAFT_376879 [Sodiomyces alkalinus F11]